MEATLSESSAVLARGGALSIPCRAGRASRRTAGPRFAGASTFARLPEVDRVSDYDVAVLGVPFDNGTSYRPGARFGPMAVRQASRHLRPGYHVELGLSPFKTIQVVDAGDVSVTPFDISAAMTQIQDHAAELITGDRRIVALGGDHTVALPLLRAVTRRQGPVALVHFDAHLDTWDTYFDAPDHARHDLPPGVRGRAAGRRPFHSRRDPRADLRRG